MMEFLGEKTCMTKDIGTNGNLFGGIMLSLLDEVGASYEMRVIHNPKVVTLKMSEVIFKKPVKVNNIVRVYGEVKKMGTSSLTIKLEAKVYNVYTEVEQIVCETDVIYVRTDEEGSAIPISDKVREKYAELLKKS